MVPMRVAVAFITILIGAAQNCDSCYTHQGDLNGCNACDNCHWSSYDSACVPMGPYTPCPAEYYHHCSGLDPKCNATQETCTSCSSNDRCSWKKSVRSLTPSGYLWSCEPTASQGHRLANGSFSFECKNETAVEQADKCDNCYSHQGDLDGCNACDNCHWSSWDSVCVPMGLYTPCPAEYYHHCSSLDPKCNATQETCMSCSSDDRCSWKKSVLRGPGPDPRADYFWSCEPTASQVHRLANGSISVECKNETAISFEILV